MTIDAVVFIPGICGSELKKDGETIWPGTPLQKVFSRYPDAYVQILVNDNDLQPTDILRSVPLSVAGVQLWSFDGYGRAIQFLDQQLGFREAAGELIPWAYDWRRDVRESAAYLKARLAADDLAGKTIALVAHSMGGLVARHMLEELGPPNSVQVELCVLVAVPHLGAPVALENLLGLRPEIFLTGPQCKQALRNAKFPSAYQLLPRPGIPTLLQRSSSTGFLEQDLYSVAIAEQLGLVAGSLEAARDFGTSLKTISPGFRPPCRYVAISGNAQKTITANYRSGAASAWAVEEHTAGDGTVPLWSSAPSGIPVRYVASEHGSIFTDAETQRLLRAVLRPGDPGAEPFGVDAKAVAVWSVQALRGSVEADTSVTVSVVASSPVDHVDAVLDVRSFFNDGRVSREEIQLNYKGGPIHSLFVDVKVPPEQAVMQCHIRNAGEERQKDIHPESADLRIATILVLQSEAAP